MGLELLSKLNGSMCQCGKVHSFSGTVLVGSSVVRDLPSIIASMNCVKPFLLADKNTYVAAGSTVCEILQNAQINYTQYIFSGDTVEPDEYRVGSAFMHLDASCDMIIGIGSGVINDIGKILSLHTGKPYIIVATAPSMDGYASASSSMTRDGLKISLPTRSADVIIGDTDILCNAPLHMMKSGLGDMLAKYVSICEWRISNLVTGEYYCEEIAALIRSAVKNCVDNAPKLLQRDATAVQAVFEGLVIGGVAMNYAGLSRPASGVEHYISHIVDMRAVEFNMPADLHGIQCAIGALLAIRMYEKLHARTPDIGKATAYVKDFDFSAWSHELRALLGKGADTMIQQEEKEQKYNLDSHQERLAVICANWDKILKIITEELPSSQQLEKLLDSIEAPKALHQIGVDKKLTPHIIKATKDIRDKYVLSRLLWDLGLLDEFSQEVEK